MPSHFTFLEYINHFQRCLRIMKLVWNMEKTKIVKFIPPNFSYSQSHVTFADHLAVATNVKIFRSLIEKFSWMPRINYLLHKLSSVSYMKRRLSHVLNKQTTGTVYFAHFHSLVNYRIIFWGNSSLCITQKKYIYSQLCCGLVQGVSAVNDTKIWTFTHTKLVYLSFNVFCGWGLAFLSN